MSPLCLFQENLKPLEPEPSGGAGGPPPVFQQEQGCWDSASSSPACWRELWPVLCGVFEPHRLAKWVFQQMFGLLRSPTISREKALSSAPAGAVLSRSSQPPLERSLWIFLSCILIPVLLPGPMCQRPTYMLAFLCPCRESLASLGHATGLFSSCIYMPVSGSLQPCPTPQNAAPDLVSCSSPGTLLPPLQDSA